MDDQASLLVREIAVEEADRAAPAHDASFGEDEAGAHRLEEADLEFERRDGNHELAFGHGGIGHCRVHHAREKAALADPAAGVTEGLDDLEPEFGPAALG